MEVILGPSLCGRLPLAASRHSVRRMLYPILSDHDLDRTPLAPKLARWTANRRQPSLGIRMLPAIRVVYTYRPVF
jgi:hypothetical protein